MSFQIDNEKTQERIAEILTRIKTEADPELLNKYRSLFKKGVPFFSRSYFAAFLLMQLEGGGRARRFQEPRNKKSRSSGAQVPESGKAEPKTYPLSEEDSVRLFISIGRNRRVFPREILGLINAETATPKDDIGAIRILDNYSFIQVRNTVADAIIEALNGKNFRGRTLVVNYARNRKEDYDEIQPELGNDEPESESSE